MENNEKKHNNQDQESTRVEGLNVPTEKKDGESRGISGTGAGAMAAGAGIAGAGIGAAAQNYLNKEEQDKGGQSVPANPVQATTDNPAPAPDNASGSSSDTTDAADGQVANAGASTPDATAAPAVETANTEQQPAYMGFAVDAGNGNTVQVVFVDVNHDGYIDQWGMQATDVTGVTQEVTGTAEQLPGFLLGGNANYAQQADYQNESSEITGMDDSFEPIDWSSEQDAPVAAEETDAPAPEIAIDEIPEAEVSEIPGDASASAEDFADYEQQMEHVQFQDWELPDHYQQDDFQGNDDFVANQFI